MIKTETHRWVVSNNVELPYDVRKALTEWNRTHRVKLDLLFDELSNQWQFYRIKYTGATVNEDTLHWQMSVPNRGTMITPGIIDWLRKYDQSNNGYLTEGELKKNWVIQWKELKRKQQKDKDNELDSMAHGFKPIIDKVSTLREQIVVPITVGFNPKTGKKIMAVKKKPKGGILIGR